MVPLRYRSVLGECKVFNLSFPLQKTCVCQGLRFASPSRMGKPGQDNICCVAVCSPCGRVCRGHSVCSPFHGKGIHASCSLGSASFSVCGIRHAVIPNLVSVESGDNPLKQSANTCGICDTCGDQPLTRTFSYSPLPRCADPSSEVRYSLDLAETSESRGVLCGGTVLCRCVVIHPRFCVRSSLVFCLFASQQLLLRPVRAWRAVCFPADCGCRLFGFARIVLARTDEPNGEPRGKKSPKLREKRGLLARPSGLAKETGFWGLCRSTKRRKREHVGSHLIDTKARLNVCKWAKNEQHSCLWIPAVRKKGV